VIDIFLRIHGLLQELAFAYSMIYQAKNLLGFGGELLVYGLANRQMNSLLHIYTKIIDHLYNNLKALDEIAKNKYEEIVFQKLHQEKIWIRHYSIASSLLNRLNTDLTNCLTTTKAIEDFTNEKNIQDRLRKAKYDTEKFTQDASRFCNKLTDLLAIDKEDLSKPINTRLALTNGNSNGD